MRIAFLNCGLQSQLATKYLVDKHNFTSFSIHQILEQVKNRHFNTIDDENFIYALKSAYEQFDKYILIRHILSKTSGVINSVISDISNTTEYYSLLMEGFIPVKIDVKEIYYDANLVTIPMLKINSESNLERFYENIDSLIDNYATLEANKTKGGIIKYIDSNSQED